MPFLPNSPNFSKTIETRCRRVAATFAQRYYPVFLENPSALNSWYAKKFSLRHSHAQQKRCTDASKIVTVLTESANIISHIYVDKMYVKVLIFPFDENDNNMRLNPNYTYKTTINISFQLTLELKDGTSISATHIVQLVDSQPNVFAITKDRLQYENDATMSQDDEDEEEAYKYKMSASKQGAGGAPKLLSVSELFQKNNNSGGSGNKAEHSTNTSTKAKAREKAKEEILAISSAAAAVAAMADKKHDDWFRKHTIPVEETHVETNKNVSYADILRANKKAGQGSATIVSPGKPIVGAKGKEARPVVVTAAAGNKQNAEAKRKAK